MTFCAIFLKGFQGIPRSFDNWMSLKSFLLFVTLVFLVSLVVGTWRDQTIDLLKSLFGPHAGRSDFNVRLHRLIILISCSGILVLSLMLSLLLWQIDNGYVRSLRDMDSWTPVTLLSVSVGQLFRSIVGIVLLLLFKATAKSIYCSVNLNGREAPVKLGLSGQFSSLAVYTVLFIILLVLNELFVLGGNILIWCIFSVWMLAEMVYAMNIYVIFNSQGVRFFQIFLYFCALEILPIIVFFQALFKCL